MLRQLTPAQAHRYRIVPFGRENGALQLYTDHPHPQRLQAELRLVLGTATALHPQPTDWVSRALAQHYRKNEAPALTGTTDFIDKLLHDAQELGSSDIHIEPEVPKVFGTNTAR
jgi:type IV pilus assembly protein PilB